MRYVEMIQVHFDFDTIVLIFYIATLGNKYIVCK